MVRNPWGRSALPTDSLTLKQQGEWVICDPPALTRQAQEGITLVDCLPDTARFPIAIEVHLATIIAQEGRNLSPLFRATRGPSREGGGAGKGSNAIREGRRRLGGRLFH